MTKLVFLPRGVTAPGTAWVDAAAVARVGAAAATQVGAAAVAQIGAAVAVAPTALVDLVSEGGEL